MAGRKIDDLAIPADCPAELKCSKCGRLKPRVQFHRKRDTRTTFSPVCIDCNADQAIETRFRREIRECGIVAFRERTRREMNIVQIRLKIMYEFIDKTRSD